MRVIVHGGAGPDPADRAGGTDGTPEARRERLEEAADAGAGSEAPLGAVVAAVGVLESDPRFNAGVGSAVESDGTIRTSAGAMTGDRAVGAACGMTGVEHAAAVARLVLEETPHVLLAGPRAVAFADAFGVETGVDLWTDHTRERWAELDPPAGGPRDQLAWARRQFGDAGGHDTVGAVASDGDRVAAATSTGGRWCALAGRVGDVPQVGSGFFASHAGAASATGAGEDIVRVTLARRAVDHLEVGRDPEAAASLAIEEFADLTGSTAGVIVMDRDGDAGSAYNSEAMGTAVAD